MEFDTPFQDAGDDMSRFESTTRRNHTKTMDMTLGNKTNVFNLDYERETDRATQQYIK